MVNDNENRMSSFQSAIRSFKHTESTAKDMIDTIYNVLDRDAQATSSIVREIGSIFEEDAEKDKAKAILEAINGFRAEVSCRLREVLSEHNLDNLDSRYGLH